MNIADTVSLGFQIEKAVISFASNFLLAPGEGGDAMSKNINTGPLYAVQRSGVFFFKIVGDILPF